VRKLQYRLRRNPCHLCNLWFQEEVPIIRNLGPRWILTTPGRRLSALALLAVATLAALAVAWPTAADTATTQSGPQLVFVSQVYMGGPAYAVAVQGDRAYVGAGNRLAVVDVSDPAALQVVGSLIYADYVQEIHVVSPYTYLIVGNHDLSVVDISNPTAPQEVGAYHFTAQDLLDDIFVVV